MRFLVLAAQRTQLLKAPREALAYFERALVQLSMTTPGTERDQEELQILLQLVPALIAVEGYTSENLPVRIGRASALCDLASDPVGLGVTAGPFVLELGRLELGSAQAARTKQRFGR